MGRYLANRLFKIGFWLFIVGSGPLLAIILLAGIGLWPDPNPNPIGPGLMAFVSFWPSVACMVIGALEVRRTPESNRTVVVAEGEKSGKQLTTVIYALYAAALLVGITAIVAIVMNYIKKDDVAGTYLESHFRWQIRTFWFGVLWAAVGTMLTAIGWLVIVANGIWIIYRIAKGWLRLNENKPMYVE